MTPEQKKWLTDHPNYSPVRDYPVVSLKGWTDRGYLYENGKFYPDDGKTLFAFRLVPNSKRPLYVGREYDFA